MDSSGLISENGAEEATKDLRGAMGTGDAGILQRAIATAMAK